MGYRWMGGMGWDGGGHASLPVDNIIGKGEDDDVDDAQSRCVSTHIQAPLGEAHRVCVHAVDAPP